MYVFLQIHIIHIWIIYYLNISFLCRLRSIAAHRDHFVRRLSVRPSVCLLGSHTFLVVTHSYVSQATHAFLGMLPLCMYFCLCGNFFHSFSTTRACTGHCLVLYENSDYNRKAFFQPFMSARSICNPVSIVLK